MYRGSLVVLFVNLLLVVAVCTPVFIIWSAIQAGVRLAEVGGY